MDWLAILTGQQSVEDAAQSWFSLPAVRIGIGVSAAMLAAGLVIWHRHGQEVRKMSERILAQSTAANLSPFALLGL